jgi:hypothetical protein
MRRRRTGSQEDVFKLGHHGGGLEGTVRIEVASLIAVKVQHLVYKRRVIAIEEALQVVAA